VPRTWNSSWGEWLFSLPFSDHGVPAGLCFGSGASTTTLQWDIVLDQIESGIKSGHFGYVFIILDCCFSAALIDALRERHELAKRVIVFASSKRECYSTRPIADGGPSLAGFSLVDLSVGCYLMAPGSSAISRCTSSKQVPVWVRRPTISTLIFPQTRVVSRSIIFSVIFEVTVESFFLRDRKRGMAFGMMKAIQFPGGGLFER
jgi:hypothetical protein